MSSARGFSDGTSGRILRQIHSASTPEKGWVGLISQGLSSVSSVQYYSTLTRMWGAITNSQGTMTYMRYCRSQDACGAKVGEKAEAVEFSLAPLCSQLHRSAWKDSKAWPAHR
jgi:hypothetical protein